MKAKKHLEPRPSIGLGINEAIDFIANVNTPDDLRRIVQEVLHRNLDTMNKQSKMHAATFTKFLIEHGITIKDNVVKV